MRGFSAALGAFLVAGAVVGCTSLNVTEVDLSPDATRALVFFVVLDDTDTITRTTTPLLVEVDGTSRGSARAVTLEGAEITVVLVRVPVDSLGPSFVAERFGDVEVRTDTAPADGERRFGTSGGVVVDAALPPAAQLSTVELGEDSRTPLADALASRVRAGITLTTPIDPEFCRDEAVQPLAPFGAEAQLDIPDDRDFAILVKLVLVEPDVVVVATRGAAYVVRRGGRIEAPPVVPGTPASWLDFANLADGGLSLEGMAVDPTTLGAPSRRLVLAFEKEVEEDVYRSYVYEVTYRDGLLGEVTTSTVFSTRARDVAFADDGTYAVIGDGGAFFSRAPGAPVRAFPIPAPVGPLDESRQVVATGDPQSPWIAGTRGRLHRFETDRQAWSSQIILRPTQESLHFAGISAVRERGLTRVWALGSEGLLLELVGEEWEERRLVMPPSFGPCSPSGSVAQPVLDGLMEALALGAGQLFPVKTGCTAVPVVREVDLCTWMLTVQGRAVERVDDFIEVVEVYGGELFAAGDDGYLYSTRIGE